MIRFFLALFLAGSVCAADLHVDREKGDDANDAKNAPVKTIAKAIGMAQAGDTIHLAPGTYYESIDLSNKHGLPGKPITLHPLKPGRTDAPIKILE